MKCSACGFKPAIVMWHPYIPDVPIMRLPEGEAPISDLGTSKFWYCGGCGRSNDIHGNSFVDAVKPSTSKTKRD